MLKIIYVLLLLPVMISAQIVEIKYPVNMDTLKIKKNKSDFRIFGGGSIDAAFSGTLLVSAKILKWNIGCSNGFHIPLYLNVSTSQNVFQEEIDYQQLAINNIINPNGGTVSLTLNKYYDLLNLNENNLIRLHSSVGGRFFPSYRNGVIDLMGGFNGNIGFMYQLTLWRTSNPRNAGIGYVQALIQGAFMDGNILRKTFTGISSNLLTFYSFSAGISLNKNIRVDYIFLAFLNSYNVNDFTGTRSRVGINFGY
jgi:hypothetical protein